MVLNETEYSILLVTNHSIHIAYNIFAVTLCAFAPFIIFGSGLIITSTIVFRKLRTRHHVLLFCLACDDLMFGLWTIPMWAMTYFEHTRPYLVEKGPCILVTILKLTKLIVNFSIINLINIDRFISIQFPLRYYNIVTKYRLAAAILIAWITSIIPSIPIIWDNKYDETVGHLHISKRSCDPYTVLKPYYLYWFLGSIWMCVFICFCLNLAVWITAKSHWKKIDRQMSRHRSMSPKNVEAQVAKRARNKVASILFTLYAVLWMPYNIVAIIRSTYLLDKYPVELEIAKSLTLLLCFINPVICAPVYAFVRKQNYNAYSLLLKTKITEWKSLKYHSLSDTNETSAMIRVTPSLPSVMSRLKLRKSDQQLNFSPKPSRSRSRIKFLLENNIKLLDIKRGSVSSQKSDRSTSV